MEIVTRYKDTLRKFVVIKEYPYFYLAQNELGYKPGSLYKPGGPTYS